MLEIINSLHLFFQDCYQRYGVREYARKMHISPPTASKLLHTYEKRGLLKKEKERQYIFYFANKDSILFIQFSHIYWHNQLQDLIKYLEQQTLNPTLILFGSLAKAEVNANSDIDLAIFAAKKDLSLKPFEKKLKRNIQLFWFPSLTEIKNKELANNILNGHILLGKISL